MRTSLIALLLLAGCPSDPPKQQMCMDNTIAPVCFQDAPQHSDFTWIKANIFDKNCFGSACHTSKGSAKLKLSTDPNQPADPPVTQADAYMNLLGTDGTGAISTIDKTRRLIVPMDPHSSYMEFMLQFISATEATPPASPPPSNIGFMPQANPVLCCQKLEAIDRWIVAGAMND
jgi:hypothetical protein